MSEREVDEAVSTLRSVVGSGRLLLTEEPLPVRVYGPRRWRNHPRPWTRGFSISERVGGPIDWDRKPGRITMQGGFPKSANGLYFVFVDPGWPPLVQRTFASAPCRWCAGDGLHPFIPTRLAQMLRCYLPIDRRVDICLGVSRARPLREYLELTLRHGIDILDGLELDKIRCPRCHGAGVQLDRCHSC